ncbi:hypothetical protein CEXT_489501 [Caerostris extrusa]|uniref:tRNA/rRNA methyltransferase SpoU type domain-containing protein n=1 Tax=Caerostris extrusa TaxID=172846 RepID=A0AAV4WIT0_CAEEX|nr:hypothetical protein CEXT_489501 [Caerostris extrusa]
MGTSKFNVSLASMGMCIQNKKAQGWSIVSTTAYNEEIKVSKQIYDVAEISVSQSTILILGNESRGVSPEVQKLCDFFIFIPPKKTCMKELIL